ncbi:UDP-N-acetylmuramoyl-L-alanine--D-glutamate ligase [Actinopolymorpha alba]|uniref:UDP-N-acetylmuramoyl-L-alanine--D-glutamate ligase n=1 Tax=Actinopolymorpha alba TaxID=533267 RepID=UPI00037949F8|nr:UDP-N-acetylmuramoyl-L-alanine--D-glutamate ligase [Actinopolymorpha alba]
MGAETKVLVLGLGLLGGGIGMARYFARRGAQVRITDLRTPEQLRPALDALSDLDAEYVLGTNRPEDVHWADIVVRNPGVRPDAPLLRLARELGKQVEMEVGYFVRHCPAPITAVTGTKGKTTTTALLHQLLESDGSPVRIAGNMGLSAIDLLDELTPDDQVLLEISAQQLEARADVGWSPAVAVITNVADDHLDRYGSLREYRRVKASLTMGQTADGWTILPGWDGELAAMCTSVPSRKVFVRDSAQPFPASAFGPFAVVEIGEDGVTWTDADGRALELCGFAEFGLLGVHNRVNLAFAAAAAYANGRSPAEISKAVPQLKPVDHRLQHCGAWRQIAFINDSAATAPIAAAASLRALSDERVVLICGGASKGSDFAPMAKAIEETGAIVVLLPGAGSTELARELQECHLSHPVVRVDGMDEAVAAAIDLAASTDATCVTLSPGCASFGLFLNEFERGHAFVEAVRARTH